jgi:NAD(P) transhydrogenase
MPTGSILREGLKAFTTAAAPAAAGDVSIATASMANGLPYSAVTIGVPKEIHVNERRVAIAPENVATFTKKGFKVVVQAGAGLGAQFTDQAYIEAGATVVPTAKDVYNTANVITKVRMPEAFDGGHEVDLLRPHTTLFSFIQPGQNKDVMDRLAARKASVFAMDCVPRISRAQVFDALSSMSNISGYRAVIEAANEFGRFFTGQITAAGKVPPAKVLIIGGGVAGLSAIATAKNMGAIVRAFDVREAAREQIESLGAEFLTVDVKESGDGAGGYAKEMSKEFLEAEHKLFAKQCKEVDIIIGTALIPGKRAPLLIDEEMVASMKKGSVTVDLAAESGGNIATTRAGERYVFQDKVTCIGYTDMPSRLPTQASTLYGNNLTKLLLSMGDNKTTFKVDFKDEVVRGSIVLQDGSLMWPAPRPAAPPAAAAKPKAAAKVRIVPPLHEAVACPSMGYLRSPACSCICCPRTSLRRVTCVARRTASAFALRRAVPIACSRPIFLGHPDGYAPC